MGYSVGTRRADNGGMPTPPLPDWIRHANVPGYTTAHLLCPDETRLFGTEDLYGDWEGGVLLLAKDWGPSSLLRLRIERGDRPSYGPVLEMRSNVRLRRLVQPIQGLGLLYGSALANLLRDDGRVSGTLPNQTEAFAYGSRVTRWVIERMPRLRWVVCLGREAWTVASDALGRGREGDWREHVSSGEPLGPLVAAFHPAARVSPEDMERPWKCIRAWASMGDRIGSTASSKPSERLRP